MMEAMSLSYVVGMVALLAGSIGWIAVLSIFIIALERGIERLLVNDKKGRDSQPVKA